MSQEAFRHRMTTMSTGMDDGIYRRTGTPGLDTVPWERIAAAVCQRLASQGVDLSNRTWNKDAQAIEQMVMQQVTDLRQHLLGQASTTRDGHGLWDTEAGDPWVVWQALMDVLVDWKSADLAGDQAHALIAALARQATSMGQELVSLAFHDGVAECATRLATARRLAQLVRRGEPFLVIFTDLDQFKGINDTFGHGVGDLVLRTMAHRWSQLLRPGDHLGRWGGDEFLFVMPGNLTQDAVDSIRERLARTLQEPVSIAGCPAVRVSASFGYARCPDDGMTVEEVLEVADQRLYRAKHQEEDLHSLIAGNEDRIAPDLRPIEVHYQPILSFEMSVVERWEALVRYRTANGSLLEARDFLTTWPQSSVVAMDRYVLITVFKDLVQWQRHGHAICVAINPAPQSLGSADWQADLEALFQAHPEISRQRISVEISESDVFRDSGVLRQTIARLSSLGHPVSLDHFGTGSVALRELPRWHVTCIKIDPVVTMQWQRDDGRAVIQSVVGLSRPLGVQVVAEGVESLEQSQAVRNWGCHAGQGWWQTPAVPAHQVPSWIPK